MVGYYQLDCLYSEGFNIKPNFKKALKYFKRVKHIVFYKKINGIYTFFKRYDKSMNYLKIFLINGNAIEVTKLIKKLQDKKKAE